MAKAATADASVRETVTFEWEGKDAKGTKQKGIMSSTNAGLVKAKLRRQGIVPTKVKKKKKSKGGGSGKVTASDIAIFARQLTRDARNDTRPQSRS